MKRRISTVMMVSGTLLLLSSMVFSTVSFAAPDLVRQKPAPSQASSQALQTECTVCSSTSATGCDTGQAPGDTFVNRGGQCFECVQNPKPKDECHCSSHRIDCPTPPECTDGDTRYCDTGRQGVCQEGTETCVDGQWSGTCAQDVPSQPEVCDSLDNDCDGATDEGGVCDECTSGETRYCDTGRQGVCQEGTETCVDGQWSGTCAQDVPSGPEVCDGLDNDCDGKVDEGCECIPADTQSCYTGPRGTKGVGICKAGTQTCDVNGQWGECMNDVGPSHEACDGLDNDCDGRVDEGLGTVTCGVGECKVTVDTCVGGEEQECVPGRPANETCDGLDNDCDGKVDEGRVCREDEEEPTPPPPGPTPPPPPPTPTPIVEVLGVEMLPVAGEMPLAPVLPTLPMILSSLTLIGGGLLLRGSDED